jgi:large subunit ribosomal protein L17
MRHGKKFNHLGRKKGHRKAMLSNMACSLIEHKRINTTVAKAKALRGFVEPLITKAKTDSTHSRRTAFKYLQSKDAVGELFREVAPKVADRPGGYTRIIRTGYRLGDNAEMCMIELVDFNELYTNEKSKKTTRRSRRGGGGAKAEVAAETTEEVVAEVEETAEVAAEETVEAKEETSATEETLAEEPKAEEAPAEETPAEETAEPEAKAEESSEEKNDDDEEAKEEK